MKTIEQQMADRLAALSARMPGREVQVNLTTRNYGRTYFAIWIGDACGTGDTLDEAEGYCLTRVKAMDERAVAELSGRANRLGFELHKIQPDIASNTNAPAGDMAVDSELTAKAAALPA